MDFLNINIVLGQGVQQDHVLAAMYYKMAADQGDIDALHNLGLISYIGQGVEQNFEDAFKYYKLAADLGHLRAQNTLGKISFLKN